MSGIKEIQLHGKHGKGKVALVSDEDYEELSKHRWRVGTHGYAMRAKWNSDKQNNDCILMHRVIADPPKGKLVDHRDMDKLNNTRENLRVTDKSGNTTNAKRRKSSTSPYKGICRQRYNGRWRAEITKDYESISIGVFDTPEEAAKAYDEKAVELFGEYARLNFPERGVVNADLSV